MNLFETTPKNERHFYGIFWISIVAGIFSALVKSGFETIIPPRTPSTMPPPEVLLEKLGCNVNEMTYTWLDNVINWGGNGVHILFSVVMAFVYCYAVEVFRHARMLHGIIFGIGVSVFAHGLVVPLLGLGGWVWFSGPEGLISEFIGTGFWIWSMEAVRANIRYKFYKLH